MVEQLGTSRSTLEAVNRELEEKYVRLRELTDALQESEERFRLIAENVNDVIWTLDSSMERFTYISPSIAQLRGFCFDEAVQEPLERAFTPQSLELLRSQLAKSVAAARESSGRISEVIEVDQICREGEVIHLEVVVSAITDSAGRLKEFVGISRDISARKKREARLKYESTHDALTGLYNRAFYEEELERVAGGDRFPVSVVVGDLDGLKLVNDTRGHEAGDQLIKGAANVLRMAFRENDVITRTGGDEFVVLLPGVGLESAQGALVRVRNCVQSYNKNSDGLPVSLSLGVAAASSGDEIPLAVRTADELMYADKVRRKQQRTS